MFAERLPAHRFLWSHGYRACLMRIGAGRQGRASHNREQPQFKKDAVNCVLAENNILISSVPRESRPEQERDPRCCPRPQKTLQEQTVRSLGPLRSTRYQASTRGLSTSFSRWDLYLKGEITPLGVGFALRCFQRFSFLDVATQHWGRPPNWLTSGPAISVLSY